MEPDDYSAGHVTIGWPKAEPQTQEEPKNTAWMSVDDAKNFQKSIEHYKKLRKQLTFIQETYNMDPKGFMGPEAPEALFDIASEALSAVFLYIGMSYGASVKSNPAPVYENPAEWPETKAIDIVNKCQGFVSSHKGHRDLQEKKGEPINSSNYTHIIDVADRATTLAKNLLQNTKQPTAKELAEEMACDMEFIQAFRDTKEMRLQRAYDATQWLWWWAWWKDGKQYIGNGHYEYEQAKKDIAAGYQLTVEEIKDASKRLSANCIPPL